MTTSSSKVNDTRPTMQSASCLLHWLRCPYLSAVRMGWPTQKISTVVSYWKSSNSPSQVGRFCMVGCDGSNHGMVNEMMYGKNSEYYAASWSTQNILTDAYNSETLSVRLWYLEEYMPWTTTPPLINLQWIKGQIGRKSVSVGASRHKVWSTISLDKVRKSFFAYASY